MTIYLKPDGDELVVCDGCGVAGDGTKPDVSALKPVDLAAALQAEGIPAELTIKDWCPDCSEREDKA